MNLYRIFYFWLFTCLYINQSFSQVVSQDSIQNYTLSEVVVSSTRLETNLNRAGMAISAIGKNLLQKGQAQLVLNESLPAIPGLFTLNPDNFSQDLRVSIRGFGARSAFGIRGIKLIVDGIPESTPDGQAQVDNIDVGIAERIEVIRGPASGLYGNASGGVISLTTENPGTDPQVVLRSTLGSYGFQRYQLKYGAEYGKISYLLYGAHTQIDGYRDQSEMQNTLLNAKIRYEVSDKTDVTLLLNYADSPTADDPGAITLDQVLQNRRQARDRNILFDGGEALSQSRIGLVLRHDFSLQHKLQARIYRIRRDFENRLAFEAGGWVEFEREFYGAGIGYTYSGKMGAFPYRFQLGIDAEQQEDDRSRFNNVMGKKVALTYDQLETFSSLGVYAIQDWELGKNWYANLGLRWDRVQLGADDAFLQNGDQSGERDYGRINPILGISYKISESVNIYGNFATSFETPALTELSSNPSAEGGFNTELKPQQARNIEVGSKGKLARNFRFELALFHIDVQDELVPYELQQFPGRTFFRNAGASDRNGLELGFSWAFVPQWDWTTSYTFSDFQYADYLTPAGDFGGKELPGIPRHNVWTEIRYSHPKGLYGRIQGQGLGKIFADDGNTVAVSAYQLVHVRVGYEKRWEKWGLEPFAGVNNVLDKAYNGNIILNGAGMRYFEPATKRFWYGGLAVTLGKNSSE